MSNDGLRFHRRAYTRRALSAAPLILFLLCPATLRAAEDVFPEEPFLKYDQDGVSMAFDNLRAADAALWMRSTTGVAITLPRSARTKTVNLKLQGARIEHAVLSFLNALELNNSFLVYDPDGRLTGAIALEKSAPGIAGESGAADDEKKASTAAEASQAEREALLKIFEQWAELSTEEQKSAQARLKEMPASKEREQLIKDYVRLTLGINEEAPPAAETR